VAAVEVHGPNVRLRIPRASDSRRLFELASDPEVTRFFSWGPYGTEEEARAWLATLPGLAVVFVGVAFSLIGDGLTDLLRAGER